jgi:RNA polymerase sigma-70 factor (ECF subfamily)
MGPRDTNSAQSNDDPDATLCSAGRNEGPANEPVGECAVDQQFEAAMAAARQGSLAALGRLFDGCRNYLLLVANRGLGESIQAKIGASDLVQETLLQAQEIFERFRGSSRKELLAWLAQTLEFKHAQTVRRYVKAEMRDVGRELPIEIIGFSLVDDKRRSTAPSPESAVRRIEKLEQFKAALERLPEDYRLVIELRGLQQKPFSELADEMQRSIGAVRKIWIRAVQRLGDELRSTAKS